VRILVIANSDSEGSRTAVRVMPNSRSEATLFLKTSQITFIKSI
jgi:hypothetical protein